MPKLAKQLTTLAFLGIQLCTLWGCGTGSASKDKSASDKRYLLGADYFRKNMVGPALEELLQAVALDPNNADAHNALGLVFLRKAADSEELSTRVQCLKGEDLQLEKQEIDGYFKKSEDHFQTAIRLRPDFSEAWNHLAVVALHFGQFDDAIRDAEKALSNVLYREGYIAQANLGWAYFQKRDYARASKAFRQALFEQAGFCVGRYRLAKVLYDEKLYTDASAEVDRVISDQNCPIQEAYHLAGIVALRMQDRGRAKGYFEKCVQMAPRSCLAKECQVNL